MHNLRIVFLEDLPTDYELNVNILKKAGLKFDHKNIDNRKDFISTLISFRPHIVISDYSLPQYDGLSAIHDMKSINSDIPLIIVTGTLDEETAAETIKKGAWDYVVKERLHRLPSAVNNALALREEIIKKREIEEALMTAEGEYESLRNNVPLALYRSTVEGELVYANPAFVDMFGFENLKDALLIKIPEYYVRPEEREELMNKLMQEGVVRNFDIEMKRQDGSHFWGSFNIKAVFSPEGEHVYQDGIISDITEFKKTREELIAAKEKAEESDRLKTAFLANMSHEIRTPMNAIVGFSDLLLDPSYSMEQREEFVKTIQSSSNTLLRIINDILDVAKIESGVLTISKKPFLLNAMLDDIYQSFRNDQKSKKLTFRLLLGHPSSDVFINNDETRIRQILNNLLVNAFKFTQKGRVDFGYEINDGNIEFFVIDTGIGIPEDKQKVIFEMFRQVDESHTREFGGTGLGLTIAKNLVDKMGGKLWLISQSGKGAEFRFTIPYDSGKPVKTAPEKDKDKGPAVNELSKYSILIAEDVDSNFEFLETILRQTKVKISRAVDGQDAVNQISAGRKFDLVLMDLRMPNMNGYEATEFIKNTNKDLPVIIQTAYALESDMEKIRATRCDDIITKPIAPGVLMEKIRRFLK